MAKITIGEVNPERVLLEAGTYNAVVSKATDGLIESGKNAGRDKIDMVFHVDGRTHIKETLHLTESMGWKINQLCSAFRLGRAGDEIEFSAKVLLGQSVSVTVIQKAIEKPDGTKMTINQITRFEKPVVEVDDMPF